MTVTTQQQAKELMDFTEVALAFVEAVKNPKAVEAIKASLIDAATISDEKKKEYESALATIAESNRIIVLAEKALNDVEVTRGFAKKQADIQAEDIRKSLEDLSAQWASFKSQSDEKNAKLAAQKASLDNAQQAVDDRNKAMDVREAALNVRESNINAKSARLSERESAVIAGEAALKAGQDELAARSQALVDAAMGKKL